VLEYAALPFFVCTRPVHFYPWEAVDNSAHALYFLCILKSAVVARYYVGISTNPHRRLEYHNSVEQGFASW
jgi:hypothetical protein